MHEGSLSTDLTEESDPLDGLEQCVVTLSGSPYAPSSVANSDCMRVMNSLQRTVSAATLFSARCSPNAIVVEPWKRYFWREVLEVVKALQTEKALLGRRFSLREWIEVRQLTISGR